MSSSSSKPQQVYFMFVVPLLHSIVFVSQDRDLRETNVSRDVVRWQTRNKAVTEPRRLFWNCAP